MPFGPHPLRLRGALALVLATLSPAVAGEGWPCLIEPHRVTEVSTAVEGVLEEVLVDKGDPVRRGDVVARLVADVEQALVEQAETRAAMRSALQAREVSLARAQEKHDRAQRLSSQRFVSPEELAELASAVDLARLELETERENLRLAGIELKRQRALLELRTIRSPVDGVVTERYLDPGEFAQAQPIVRLAQIDPLNVEAVLPAAAYGQVQVGAPARVRMLTPGNAELDGRVLTGTVVIVEKVIDAASGTFAVRAEVPNPDHGIPAGLECSVTFE